MFSSELTLSVFLGGMIPVVLIVVYYETRVRLKKKSTSEECSVLCPYGFQTDGGTIICTKEQEKRLVKGFTPEIVEKIKRKHWIEVDVAEEKKMIIDPKTGADVTDEEEEEK